VNLYGFSEGVVNWGWCRIWHQAKHRSVSHLV
jgi:hypothetical protein